MANDPPYRTDSTRPARSLTPRSANSVPWMASWISDQNGVVASTSGTSVQPHTGGSHGSTNSWYAHSATAAPVRKAFTGRRVAGLCVLSWVLVLLTVVPPEVCGDILDTESWLPTAGRNSYVRGCFPTPKRRSRGSCRAPCHRLYSILRDDHAGRTTATARAVHAPAE